MNLYMAGSSILLIASLTLLGCDTHTEHQNNSINIVNAEFDRPADGKLSEKQVEDYIRIRRKIISDVQLQKRAKTMTLAEQLEHSPVNTEPRYFDEIEEAAAQSFKMSYEEFLWIKDVVITTQTSLLVQQYYDLNIKIMVLLDKTLNRFEELKANDTGQQEQKIMDGYVNEMKQEMTNLQNKMADPEKRTETEQHNVKVISKFQEELETLEEKVLRSVE